MEKSSEIKLNWIIFDWIWGTDHSIELTLDKLKLEAMDLNSSSNWIELEFKLDWIGWDWIESNWKLSIIELSSIEVGELLIIQLNWRWISWNWRRWTLIGVEVGLNWLRLDWIELEIRFNWIICNRSWLIVDHSTELIKNNCNCWISWNCMRRSWIGLNWMNLNWVICNRSWVIVE